MGPQSLRKNLSSSLLFVCCATAVKELALCAVPLSKCFWERPEELAFCSASCHISSVITHIQNVILFAQNGGGDNTIFPQIYLSLLPQHKIEELRSLPQTAILKAAFKEIISSNTVLKFRLITDCRTSRINLGLKTLISKISLFSFPKIST